jgi:hypothetical protein
VTIDGLDNNDEFLRKFDSRGRENGQPVGIWSCPGECNSRLGGKARLLQIRDSRGIPCSARARESSFTPCRAR